MLNVQFLNLSMKIQKYLLKFVNSSMSKSHFQNVAALWRCGCFSGNFLQYLRAALPSESYTSRWLLWIKLYSYFVSLLHWLFLVFRGTGGLQYSSLQWNAKAIQNWSSTLFFPQEIMLLAFVSYKLWDFRKNSLKNMWNCEQRRDYCKAVRNAVKLIDTRWNCESWDIEIRLILLGKEFFF